MSALAVVAAAAPLRRLARSSLHPSADALKSQQNTITRAASSSSSAAAAASSQPSRSFDAVVFDMDGVLYPADNGYMAHVRSNARRFIALRYGTGTREYVITVESIKPPC
jgi:hypothetical protein